MAVSTDGRSLLFRDRVTASGLQISAPVRSQQLLPTSRPRQADRAGHHIDLFLTQRVLRGRVEIMVDSHQLLGTNHEALFGAFKTRRGRVHKRCPTRPRVWTGGVDQVDFVDQSVLEDLAKKHTRPRPGRSYKDPDDVKALFRRARTLKTRESWKASLQGRKLARKQWEQERLARAATGDWQAFREYKRQGPIGWEIDYAEAQSSDVHQSVHDHLKQIYAGRW